MDTAKHYALSIELVESYRKNLNLKYFRLRYEDLVVEPECQIRKLLGFIGLPWEDACLDFHKSTRTAKTASYAQVSEKLYSRSMYRYKHYRQQVEEILPILEPAMQSLGYHVDD
jgi:hypothetical protein